MFLVGCGGGPLSCWDGSRLELIALMEKRADGWFWAEYDDEGHPDYSGKPEVCIDCHANGSDSVRAFGLQLQTHVSFDDARKP